MRQKACSHVVACSTHSLPVPPSLIPFLHLLQIVSKTNGIHGKPANRATLFLRQLSSFNFSPPGTLKLTPSTLMEAQSWPQDKNYKLFLKN